MVDQLWTMSDLSHRRMSVGALVSPAPGPEWALVLDGKVELETAEASVPLGRGDAVLVDGRTAHRLIAVEPVEVAVSDLQPVLVRYDLPTPLVVRDFGTRHPAVTQLVAACALSGAGATSTWSLSYAGLIGSAMVTSWLESDLSAPSAGTDDAVARLLSALAADPGGDWTLPQMADAVHLSRSALVTRFRRATGRTPVEVLRDLRMHEARRLLCEGDQPIGVVAHAVGYGSTAAFSRAFSRHHDVTPQSWRGRAAASGSRLRPGRRREPRPGTRGGRRGRPGARRPARSRP
jgi:AraC-like DNA-binding protein